MRHLLYLRGHYYFRSRTPSDLQHIFQCKEIKKALKTRNLKTAASSIKLISNEFYRIIKVIRSGILNGEQLKQIVQKFLGNTLLKSKISNISLKKSTRDLLVSFLDFSMRELQAHPDDNENGVKNIVDRFMEEKAGKALDKNSSLYRELRENFIKALSEACGTAKMRLRDNFDNELKPEYITAKKQGKVLSKVVAEYINEKTNNLHWKSKYEDEQIRLYNQFVKIIGDKDIAEIDRINDILRYVEILKAIPKNLNKVKYLREKQLEDIISLIERGELSTYQRLDKTTINKKLTSINSLFRYAQDRGYITINPAKDVQLKNDGIRKDEEREAYDTNDLVRWFNSPVFTVYTPEKLLKRPERFWIPLIMLFSGCRPTEVCQLYKNDIKSIEGIWCFDINDEGDKQLKTPSSKRLVPIHPFLMKLGFLKYVNSVNHERLWSNLKKGRDGYAQYYNKWADEYNKKYITKNRKRVPYSLRHNFTDFLKQSRESGVVIDEITGHTVKGESLGRYGKRYAVDTLFDTIKKIDYGIDFSHLKFPIAKKKC